VEATALKKLFVIACALLFPVAAHAQSSTYALPYPTGTPLNQPTPGNLALGAVDRWGNVQIGALTPIPETGADITATGNLDMTTTASTVAVSCAGKAKATLLLVRTAQTGNIRIEGSQDGGTTWLALYPAKLDQSGDNTYTTSRPSAASTIDIRVNDGTASYEVGCAGYPNLRARVSSTGTGSLPVYLTVNPNPPNWSAGGLPSFGVFPSDPGASVQPCTAAIVNTTPVVIGAAVAATRYYVQSFRCNNQNTTATEVQLLDGSTVIDDCYLASNALAQDACVHTFPGLPLRGSVNTALNVKTVTTAASVVCCINGFTSTF
jgi:hypothetical protein